MDSILVSGEHLLLVINDILDFGKIEHGKTELEVKPLNLYQVPPPSAYPSLFLVQH